MLLPPWSLHMIDKNLGVEWVSFFVYITSRQLSKNWGRYMLTPPTFMSSCEVEKKRSFRISSSLSLAPYKKHAQLTFLYFLFYPHTFSPWSSLRVWSMQGFKVADTTFHWDLFASTHNLFVNTSLVTNSPFVKVHGYKCYLTSHFTQITVILWWEKPRLGISRFQSLIICFEQIVLKSSLIRVWTSKRLKRLRVYYASLTG